MNYVTFFHVVLLTIWDLCLRVNYNIRSLSDKDCRITSSGYFILDSWCVTGAYVYIKSILFRGVFIEERMIFM